MRKHHSLILTVLAILFLMACFIGACMILGNKDVLALSMAGVGTAIPMTKHHVGITKIKIPKPYFTPKQLTVGKRVRLIPNLKEVMLSLSDNRDRPNWSVGMDLLHEDLISKVMYVRYQGKILARNEFNIGVSFKHNKNFGACYWVPIECIRPLKFKSKSTGIRWEQLVPGAKVKICKDKVGNNPADEKYLGKVVTIKYLGNPETTKYPISVFSDYGYTAVRLSELDTSYGVVGPK